MYSDKISFHRHKIVAIEIFGRLGLFGDNCDVGMRWGSKHLVHFCFEVPVDLRNKSKRCQLLVNRVIAGLPLRVHEDHIRWRILFRSCKLA